MSVKLKLICITMFYFSFGVLKMFIFSFFLDMLVFISVNRNVSIFFSFYFSVMTITLIYYFWVGVRDYIHVVDLAKGHIAAVRKLKDNCGCKVWHFFSSSLMFSILTSFFLSFTFLCWSLCRFIIWAQVQATQCCRWWMPWKKLQVVRWGVNLLWSKCIYIYICIICIYIYILIHTFCLALMKSHYDIYTGLIFLFCFVVVFWIWYSLQC